jgi:hypothetical protein
MRGSAQTKPGRRDIDIILNLHDARVFNTHLRRNKTTQGELLSQIIHEWATHPSRFPGNLTLPAQNSVLLKGESLRSYLSRVALAAIHTVLASEGNMKATARRLSYERTAFHSLFARLKARQRHAPVYPHSDGVNGFLSLEKLIDRHVHYALELCNDDKDEACAFLEIDRSRLDEILNTSPAGNGERNS